MDKICLRGRMIRMEFKSDEEAYKWYVWQSRKEALSKIWWRIWNATLLLWWYRLWIRPNEFDKSLEWDDLAYIAMSSEKRNWYDRDLCIRRQIAHKREINSSKVNMRVVFRDILGHLKPTSEWRTAESHIDYIIAHKDETMANFEAAMSNFEAQSKAG